MIDHVSIAVRDLDAATRFYEAVLGALGLSKLEARPATVGFGKTYPEFWINLRAGMMPLAPTSGAHVCFRARSTELVDAFHAAALAAGALSDGAPGFRSRRLPRNCPPWSSPGLHQRRGGPLLDSDHSAR
jgi:catechol 2,3-dioxygenase-like lactoylglutathione lyase family enzyme